MLHRVTVALIAASIAALIALPGDAWAGSPEEWSRPTEPFRIVGNVYWVGTHDLSSFLITSDEGHIVINTGLVDSVPQIRANIEALGFATSDVKILTATHAHWDHVAGLAALKELTGAQVMMSAPDADVLESGGKSDFRWGSDPDTWFTPVKVDRRLEDGDTIRLGGNELTLHLHAGHTKGASRFTFAEQKALEIDVFLSSHASQFGLHEKRKPGDAYDPDRFVNPKGLHAAVEKLDKGYRKQLASERE